MLALLCFLRCNSQHWDASGSFLAWYLPYLIDVFTKEMSTARYKLNEFHVLRFSYVLLATYGRLNHWKEVVCFNGFPCPAKFKVKVLGILQWNCWPQLFSVSGWGVSQITCLNIKTQAGKLTFGIRDSFWNSSCPGSICFLGGRLSFMCAGKPKSRMRI